MTAGKPLCFCYNVTEEDVVRHLADGLGTYESLVGATRIGTKCTACLLDLDLVLAKCHQGRNKAIIDEATESFSGLTFRQMVDFTDSGFFIGQEGMSTTVRLSNYGQLYRSDSAIVPFQYDLFLFSEAGKVIGRRRGEVPCDSGITLDVTAGLKRPEDGWFLLSLLPLAEGYFGTLRPQVAIAGGEWCATYHTQPHMMASTGKYRYEVVMMGNGECLATAISMINTTRRDAAVEIVLRDPAHGGSRSEAMTLPAMGSRVIELDALFPGAVPDRPLFVAVHSDQPARKHIINMHRDGSWSVDHFPN